MFSVLAGSALTLQISSGSVGKVILSFTFMAIAGNALEIHLETEDIEMLCKAATSQGSSQWHRSVEELLAV